MGDTFADRLTKPFSVGGETVTTDVLRDALHILRLTRFQSSDLRGHLYVCGLPRYADGSEAANRLLQRYRKLDLIYFSAGYWYVRPGAWDRTELARPNESNPS